MGIDGSACILWALLLLTLPLDWLFAVLLAAGFHELCHVVAVKLAGGQIYGIHIGMHGAVIETDALSNIQEFFCVLAGPAGSLLLILFCCWIPKVSVCAMVQALYNLLPVYPMDGGRLLGCGLRMVISENSASVICKLVEILTLTVIASVSIAASTFCGLGLIPILIATMLVLRVLARKRPCKESDLAVQ